MYWEAMIELVNKCTLRPGLSEFGDALARNDPLRLEVYLPAVDLEAVDLEPVNLKEVELELIVSESGATGAETLFIVQLAIVAM